MIDINYKDMGYRIKEARRKLGMTQEKLAEAIDVSPSYISEIERGSSICSLAVLVNIADILGLNLDNLVLGTNISNVDTTFSEILNNISKNEQKLYIDICRNIANSFK